MKRFFSVALLLSILMGMAIAHQDEYAGPTIYYKIDGANQLDADIAAKLDAQANRYMEVLKQNYALIVQTLKVEDKPLTAKFVVILMSPDYDGSAVTYGYQGGMVIKIGDKYALKSPNDVGVIVHEMTHVVQHYTKGEHPTWLGEGIADYVRWFFYEPAKKRPHPKLPKANAEGSYQTTAAFLYWAATKYDALLVPKLNMVLQSGKYNDDVFRQFTGLTLAQLNDEWRSTLDQPEPKDVGGGSGR